ncbi:hypothetical protein [Dyella ginsengisoli]
MTILVTGASRVIADRASPNAVILPASVMPILVAALARKSRGR